MNFYFQSGEFIGGNGSPWTDLIVNLVGGIIAGFLVSAIFFGVTTWWERRKEQKRISDLREYLRKAMVDLNDPIEKQIKEAKRLVMLLSQPYDSNLSQLNFSDLNASNIKWISKPDLQTIVVKENTDLLKELNAELNYLDYVSPHISKLFDDFIMNKTKYSEAFIDGFRKIRTFRELMRVDFERARREDRNAVMTQFQQNVQTLFGRWITMVDGNQPVNIIEGLLLPLREVCIQHELEPYAFEMIVTIDECRKHYWSIQNHRNLARIAYLFSVRRLRKCTIRLKRIHSKI